MIGGVSTVLLHLIELLLSLVLALLAHMAGAVFWVVDGAIHTPHQSALRFRSLPALRMCGGFFFCDVRFETAGDVAGVLVDLTSTLLAVEGVLAAELVQDLLRVLLGGVRGVGVGEVGLVALRYCVSVTGGVSKMKRLHALAALEMSSAVFCMAACLCAICS